MLALEGAIEALEGLDIHRPSERFFSRVNDAFELLAIGGDEFERGIAAKSDAPFCGLQRSHYMTRKEEPTDDTTN
jgi:hypothetical protein